MLLNYIGISLFQGCERSSFPCELSTYGCCPDGETAALGKNGTGCGENCLTTKFGCCPDGKTTAKGTENEGKSALIYTWQSNFICLKIEKF